MITLLKTRAGKTKKETSTGIYAKTDTTILTYWAESSIRLHTYKKALIWGSQFVSRGTDYCEKAKHNEGSERYGADSRRTPSNPHNKL